MEPAGAASAFPRQISSTHVALVGGGHANIQVLELLAKGLNKAGNVHLSLVSESRYSFYSGMLPGCVAGLYEEKEIRIDLELLCEYYGATFIEQKVIEIRPAEKVIVLQNNSEITFDFLSINVGSVTRVRVFSTSLCRFSLSLLL